MARRLGNFLLRTSGRGGKWVRLALCLALVCYVGSKVHWHDEVTLSDGTTARLLSLADRSVLIERAGAQEALGLEHLRMDVNGSAPQIRLGVFSAFRRANLALLAIAVLLWGPQPFLLALRLRVLASVQNVGVSVRSAIRLTYLGSLFNFVLPGSSGGDAVKAYGLSSDRRKHRAISIVIVDRAIGLAGLMVVALLALTLTGDPAARQWLRPVGGLLTAIGGLALLYASSRARRLLRFDRLIAALPFRSHVQRLDHSLLAYARAPRAVWRAALLTFAVHGISTCSAFFAGWAIGIVDPTRPWSSVAPYFVYVPLGWVVAAIPLSLNGLGLMEETYIRLFHQSSHLATSSSQAFLLAILVRSIQLAWALPGLYWVATELRTSRQRDQGTVLSQIDAPPPQQPASPVPVFEHRDNRVTTTLAKRSDATQDSECQPEPITLEG